ncbi:MAG: metallophosphoesterase [Candidatus Krumholzibacteriota bacterium]|nr:metallophosphoesterase [Candidatus Krumholzibacteriota bacterium]
MINTRTKKGDHGSSKTNRMTCIIISAIFLLAGSAAILRAESFRLVFMSDIHLMPELNGTGGFRAAIERINQLDPDLVITGGDLIYDALEVDQSRAGYLYDLYIEMRGGIEAPVYDVIGNHEIFGLYPASGVDSGHPLYGKKMFMEKIGGGSTYRSFDFRGWHFILLDTIEFRVDRRYFGFVGKKQLEWIARDLEKTGRDKPIILAGHIPLVTAFRQIKEGAASISPPAEVVVNSHEVLALFDRYNLKLVLQGHLHIVEQIAIRGTHFVTGGAVSGAWWKGPYEGFPEGFVVIDIDGEKYDYFYESFGWKARN